MGVQANSQCMPGICIGINTNTPNMTYKLNKYIHCKTSLEGYKPEITITVKFHLKNEIKSISNIDQHSIIKS